MTPLHLNPRTITVPRANDGRWYSDGRTIVDVVEGDTWAAWPINPDGFLADEDVQNENARYRITAFNPSSAEKRWGFFDGGAFVFSAINAEAGNYEAYWEVEDADGQGNSITGTVSVTVC